MTEEKTTHIIADKKNITYPDSNEIRFHGTLEELKKYMPELYAKMIKNDT